MLVNLNEMLPAARSGKYAVGAFNVYNYETVRAVVDAANESGSPVILAFGEKYLPNMELSEVAALARLMAEKSSVPICLHLDHCSKKDVIYKAIQAGFSSVMYDGSSLRFDENLKNTKDVCDAAHACGVTVEAELGSLAAGMDSHEGSADDREVYTDPAAAAEFVKETEVDALAVSIGAVHGMYVGEPNIRIDILSDINERAQTPLVLHGGSGIPEPTIRECIQNGICKINVNTETSVYTIKRTRELLDAENPHLSTLSLKQRRFIGEIVKKYMLFFKQSQQIVN